MRIWSTRMGWLVVATTMYLTAVQCVKTKVDRSRKKTSNSSQQSSESTQTTLVTHQLNLCSKERDMKLICHCSPIDKDVTLVADCWIYREDLPESDASWRAFEARRSVQNLTLTVHGQGNLSYIPTQVMRILRNLTSLTVSYSQIEAISRFALANLTQLSRVDIVNNSHLAQLQDYAFSNHPHLVTLNLERNGLVDMEANAFSQLPVLERLQLHNNNITHLKEGVFNQLGRLIELDLRSNQINSMTRGMLKGLGSLGVFKLTGNNLSFIGDTVFAELWSLKELHLDFNRIERISERAFDGLNTLATLNLSHNRLLFLENGIFTVVPALNNLYLNVNHLETLSYNNFYPIYENLLKQGSTLDISENRFTCDCRLNWIFELRNRTKNKKLKKSLQDVECMLFSKEIKASLRAKTNFGISVKTQMSDFEAHDLAKKLQNLDYHGLGQSETPPSFDARLQNHPIVTQQKDHEEIDSDNVINPNLGIMTQLLKLRPEDLPCPQTETIVGDPTELPLSPEKVYKDNFFNFDSPNPASHSHANRVGACSVQLLLLLHLLLLSVLSAMVFV